MILKELKFHNYRNIQNPNIELSPLLNIFIGENAQGKTNILEAVFLLMKAKTFRPAKNIHIINKDSHTPFSAIAAHLVDKSVKRVIELQFKENSKSLLLDGKRISASKLQKNFPVILFSPESLAAIKNGPEERRALIDDWISLYRPEASEIIAAFEKAHKVRNKLLRDHKTEKIYLDEFERLFDSINASYYQASYQLTALRIEAIKSIHSFFNKAMQRISNSKTKSDIKYFVSDKDVTDLSDDELQLWLKTRAAELRIAEVSSGTSLFGAHKHDVMIRYDENDSRYFCSQGQQRALILSFKIAQIVYYNARYGVFPLLLLDDVLSELDEAKRSFLVEFLKNNNAQTFISSTELDPEILNQGKDMKVFEVSAGKIRVRNNSQALQQNGEQLL